MTLLQAPPPHSEIATRPAAGRPRADYPTVWGLDPIGLHDYYWAARGVQVVRLGEPSSVIRAAELYLLTLNHTLVLFRTRPLVDALSWLAPFVLVVRVNEIRRTPYSEHAITRPDGTFVHFKRSYAHASAHSVRVGLTADPDIAHAWQSMHDTARPWRELRHHISASRRETRSVRGYAFDRESPADLSRFVKTLVQTWPAPSSTIARATHHAASVWSDPDSRIPKGARFVGHVWVGAGRTLKPDDLVVGPTILWDDPDRRPTVQSIQWRELEPSAIYTRPATYRRRSSMSATFKRFFDICFALLALLLTFPLYPLVMLAILLEDGYPFFFAHQRETMHGREFPCIKFRSMRKDAEQVKASIAHRNQADGPQFYLNDDPRLTRVGRFIRRTNIDELPQFWNVLAGHMSVVGPRPSPRRENQFCPAWREARLSVRPGITGLWQVNRTRIRGADFQEWIKYDIEYVENQSWRLDLGIIWKTVVVILRGLS